MSKQDTEVLESEPIEPNPPVQNKSWLPTILMVVAFLVIICVLLSIYLLLQKPSNVTSMIEPDAEQEMAEENVISLDDAFAAVNEMEPEAGTRVGEETLSLEAVLVTDESEFGTTSTDSSHSSESLETSEASYEAEEERQAALYGLEDIDESSLE